MALYLVGSGQDPLLMELAGEAQRGTGKAAPRVVCSFAATEGDDRLTTFMRERTRRMFPGATVDVLEGVREPVDRADLIFVSGGDAALGARVLARSGADVWLREAHARKVPILAVSAGTIMLGAWWAEWPEDGSPPELVPCAGVLPGLVFDCHDEESDWEELRAVAELLEKDRAGAKCRFYGVPSGGALLVDDEGKVSHRGKPPFVLE